MFTHKIQFFYMALSILNGNDPLYLVYFHFHSRRMHIQSPSSSINNIKQLNKKYSTTGRKCKKINFRLCISKSRIQELQNRKHLTQNKFTVLHQIMCGFKNALIKNKPITRGQALNGILEHYADI